MANTTVKKMTKRMYFEYLEELVNNFGIKNSEGVDISDDTRNFIHHEIELLNKKSGTRAMTATQKENVEIKENIKAVLNEIGKPVTISEMQAFSDAMRQYSTSKLSALLTQLREAGEVIRTTEKRKSYFSLATTETEVEEAEV